MTGQQASGTAGRRPTRLASIVVAGALGVTLSLTGCSGGHKGSAGSGNRVSSSEAPMQAVSTALDNLGRQSSLELSVSIPLTQQQLERLKDKSGSVPTPQEAKALSSGRIFLTVATGHGEALDSQQAQTDQQSSVDLGLVLGSDTPFELRYIHQNLFARLQLRTLLSDVGAKSNQASKIQAEGAQINALVPGVSSFLQGSWAEVDHASLQALGNQMKQALGTSAPSNSSSFRAALLQARSQLAGALKSNSTLTSAGSAGGRLKYSASINVAGLLRAAVPILQNVFSSLPAVGSKAAGSLGQLPSAVPSGQTAVMDLYVASNKLNEVDMDLNQFKHQLSGPLPLRVSLSSPGAPSAPTGVTRLDLSKLPAFLGSILKGLLGSSSVTR